jgi:tetratricopeptide (TPR) repeat protein
MHKKTAIGLILVCLCLSAVGCGKNQEYKSAFEQAVREKSGADLVTALLDLDQRYPDTFEIKSRLGDLYLAGGDLDPAETFLKKAEGLLSTAGDDRSRYDVLVNLGVLQFEKKAYAESQSLAEKAAALVQDDPRGAIFLKARDLFMLGKKDEAVGLYEKNWGRRALMSRLDCNLYFDQCVQAKSFIRALEVLAAWQEQFDFTPGQGIQASQIYERLGMIDESVLTVAMELEYLLSSGGIDRGKIRERLAEIGRKLEDKTFNPKQAGRELLAGLVAWFAEDWGVAQRAFAPLSISHYYFDYLRRAAELENAGATVELLKAYTEGEKYFKSLPAFFRHFWRGMKKGKGEYTYATAREVLEKTVLLAPGTEYAAETRREIGRLLGLNPSDGERLLLPPELAALGARLAGGEPPVVLEPAVALLALPDNVYTLQGIVFLRELSRRLPAVGSYLEKKKSASTGRLRERLVMILET